MDNFVTAKGHYAANAPYTLAMLTVPKGKIVAVGPSRGKTTLALLLGAVTTSIRSIKVADEEVTQLSRKLYELRKRMSMRFSKWCATDMSVLITLPSR